jgi:hypothetical protein
MITLYYKVLFDCCLFILYLIRHRLSYLLYVRYFLNSTIANMAMGVILWFYPVCLGKVHPCTGLRFCTGRTAHRGSRGIAVPFLGHGTIRGWAVCVTPRPLFTPGKDQVPIVQKAGWAPGPVWTGAENLAPNGIRSPDLPARSQSLYRLSYPAHSSMFNAY